MVLVVIFESEEVLAGCGKAGSTNDSFAIGWSAGAVGEQSGGMSKSELGGVGSRGAGREFETRRSRFRIGCELRRVNPGAGCDGFGRPNIFV